MDDRTLLDLLAADAPGPSPAFADAVVGRARRVRRRRRLTVAASAAVVCAAAAVLPVLWTEQTAGVDSAVSATSARGGYDRQSDEQAKPAASGAPTPLAGGALESGDALQDDMGQKPGARPEVPDAPAYAVALTASGAGRADPLVVLDAFCSGMDSCAPGRLPGPFKAALKVFLPSVAFTTARTDRTAVRLGPAAPEGDDLVIVVNGRPVRVSPTADGGWTAV
ncbi:hypothetical protein EDD29_6046 [Actinocorallia herbida]|uniref:Uncharacterized protein n=1 Tax=Actinocorallia herbida TaxID=58109 RepID=A0A3N1D4D3_9ACTN|nr:hypothetical protein [Actinocorallia herbida]ROO88377.1 hypothetical protein EDD29_6046 [Actinocorallia herbida]